MTDQTSEERARQMGWRPADEYNGPTEKWVDADEFLRRGEEILPIVRAENKRLHDKQDNLTREIQRLTQVVGEQRQSMTEFAQYAQAQLKEKLAEQRKSLTSQLRQAEREENDTLVDQIRDELDENEEARDRLKAAPQQQQQQQPQTVADTPEYIAWKDANPWYGGQSAVDRAKTAAAERFGLEVSRSGKTGPAFFAEVDRLMEEVYPRQKRRDPTEEGRPSGGSGNGSVSGDAGFNSLPAEAKTMARKQAAKFVGPNKIFKTEKEWFAHFASQYGEA